MDRALIAISCTNPEMHQLPFEIAHDGERFLQTGNRMIFRYINDGVKITPRLGGPGRVLVVLSEPKGVGDYPPWGRDAFASKIGPILENTGRSYKLIDHAGIRDVDDHLREERDAQRFYDTIIIISHGKPATETQDASLIFERPGTGSEEYHASNLATSLSGHKGCTLVLFACNSASADMSNAVASIAYQSIRGGQVGAVLAMQRMITVDSALEMCETVLRSIRTENDIFTVFHDTINVAGTENCTPCLYTRIPPSLRAEADGDFELVEKSILISLFAAPLPEKMQVVFSLATLFMGVPLADYRDNKQKWYNIPQGTFHYRGPTVARSCLIAIQGVLTLLGKLLPADQVTGSISIIGAEELKSMIENQRATHFFVMGSRSHELARPLLESYSQDFRFKFDAAAWHIIDQRTGIKYSTSDPSATTGTDDSGGDDFALIEKIVNFDGSVFFFIAGLWDTSTLAAGQYLVRHRRALAERYGPGGFQLVLRTVKGLPSVRRVEVERPPTLRS